MLNFQSCKICLLSSVVWCLIFRDLLLSLLDPFSTSHQKHYTPTNMASTGFMFEQLTPVTQCLSPELSQVVVPLLAICGACDAHREAWLELPELQQDDGQIVDEEQSVHQGHGVLHDALVVLILRMMKF